jgi:hypothetical protein
MTFQEFEWEWENWFAWFPVKTTDHKWVWFETVERAWLQSIFSYVYRRIDKTPKNINFAI